MGNLPVSGGRVSRGAIMRGGSSVPDVTIASTTHDLTDARLHRWAKTLSAAGLVVHVDAVGNPSSAPPSVSTTARSRVTGWRRLLHALSLARKSRGNVLVVLDPELPIAALFLSRRRGQMLVADVHEDYVAVAEDRSWARGRRQIPVRFAAQLATRVAANAHLTVVADDHVPPHRAKHRLVARNVPSAAAPHGPARLTEPPKALYVGDIRHSRGLVTMVEAVLAAEPWELDLIGAIADADVAWVQHRLAQRATGERVRIHGRLPPEQAWRHAEGAWLGLALLDDTPAFRSAVPTKAYEYLAHGLPIVATPLPRLKAILDASGAGTTVNDANEAASVLRAWHGSPERVERCQRAALRWAQEHLPASEPLEHAAAVIHAFCRKQAAE